VVFPTGTALFGDTLFIYYGAADSHIACASLKLSALIAELLTNMTVVDNNIDTITEIKSKLPLKSKETPNVLKAKPKTKKPPKTNKNEK